MREVKVKVSELIDKVRANRAKHIAEFNEACAGYKTDALAAVDDAVSRLRDKIEELRDGELIRLAAVQFSLPYPQSHQRDYEQAIAMLEMSVDAEITISDDEFRQYVMDDWDWKGQFDAIRMSYSNAR